MFPPTLVHRSSHLNKVSLGFHNFLLVTGQAVWFAPHFYTPNALSSYFLFSVDINPYNFPLFLFQYKVMSHNKRQNHLSFDMFSYLHTGIVIAISILEEGLSLKNLLLSLYALMVLIYENLDLFKRNAKFLVLCKTITLNFFPYGLREP